jgi:hypothetical protein
MSLSQARMLHKGSGWISRCSARAAKLCLPLTRGVGLGKTIPRRAPAFFGGARHG